MTADPFEAEIARLEAELEKVRGARAVYLRIVGGGAAPAADPAPPAEEPPPGKPTPRPAPAAGASRSLPAGQLGRDERAVQVARLLDRVGPLRTEELAGRLEVTANVAKWAIDHRPAWFQKAGGNRLAPWELTPAGRAAAAGTA